MIRFPNYDNQDCLATTTATNLAPRNCLSKFGELTLETSPDYGYPRTITSFAGWIMNHSDLVTVVAAALDLPRKQAEATLLARAHRWKKLLDTGKYATIKELAETEKVAARYVGQRLQLTLLAPDITDMILDGRLPRNIGLAQFMQPWPGVWEEQRAHLRSLAQG